MLKKNKKVSVHWSQKRIEVDNDEGTYKVNRTTVESVTVERVMVEKATIERVMKHM